jgi:hypothetical protein
MAAGCPSRLRLFYPSSHHQLALLLLLRTSCCSPDPQSIQSLKISGCATMPIHARFLSCTRSCPGRSPSHHRTAQQHSYHHARKNQIPNLPLIRPRPANRDSHRHSQIPAAHTNLLRNFCLGPPERHPAPRRRRGRRRGGKPRLCLCTNASQPTNAFPCGPLNSFTPFPAGCSMKATAAGEAVGAGQHQASAGRTTQQHRRARLRDRPTRREHLAVHRMGRGPSLEGLLVVAAVCPGMCALRGIPTQSSCDVSGHYSCGQSSRHYDEAGGERERAKIPVLGPVLVGLGGA